MKVRDALAVDRVRSDRRKPATKSYSRGCYRIINEGGAVGGRFAAVSVSGPLSCGVVAV